MSNGKGGFIGQDGLNAPDPATGVSASGGDTQATVSFTAPSDVGGAAITGYQVQSNNGDGTPQLNSYDLNGATKTSNEFSYTHLADIKGLFFKSDGTKLYTNAQGSNTVYQYSLSTAWDITTASYDSVSFSTSSQNTASWGLHFKPDGTKMYTYGSGADKIFRYGLSTAWDLSTASYDSQEFSFSSQDTGPVGVWFKTDDGTKMYMIGFNNRTVYQYSLSTGWDVSSASYSSTSFSASSQVAGPACVVFNDDGTRMFISCYSTEKIYQYNLSTAWDVSSASYSSYSIDMTSVDTNVRSVFFKDDGSKLYVNGDTSDKIYEFTTGQEAGSYPTSSPVTITGLTNGTSYTFNVWAINPFGWSSPSDASGSVSPVAPRGLFAGGLASGGVTSNVIDYLIISTTGNATDFGDLTAATRDIVSYGSNGTRAVFGLGFTTDVNNPVNTLEYVTIFSTGNATDFGDATVGRRLTDAGFSSSTRGVNGGGRSSSSINLNVIDYITIATTGNATDFGNLSAGRQELSGLASPTRGIFAGGGSNPKNTIDYITISSTGNATDFGDLTQGQNNFAGLSSNTRGVFGGGEAAGNVMQYITIASTGNSTDFGDLTRSTYHLAGTSTSTRGVFGGGASFSNIVDYIAIATTGNATDFGDLTVGRQELGATSSAHGGLS